MPNGGPQHCGHCKRYLRAESRCGLRDVPIERSHWTVCRNYYRPHDPVMGPIYAIVCEIRDGAGCYLDIPYFDGIRVDTVSIDEANTAVRFTTPTGVMTFPSVDEYLRFYRNSGRLE